MAALIDSNNLSDVADPRTARENLFPGASEHGEIMYWDKGGGKWVLLTLPAGVAPGDYVPVLSVNARGVRTFDWKPYV